MVQVKRAVVVVRMKDFESEYLKEFILLQDIEKILLKAFFMYHISLINQVNPNKELFKVQLKYSQQVFPIELEILRVQSCFPKSFLCAQNGLQVSNYIED